MTEARDISIVKKRMQALKRGKVHRVKQKDMLPTSVHLVGVGKAGADYIAQAIKNAPSDFLQDERQRFTALAVDIGDSNLGQVQELATKLPADKTQVRTLALEVPTRDELFSSLRRYREYLKLEFPRYYWNPNYEPWLPEQLPIPESGESCSRALAKAIYGKAYYEDPKPIERELEAFAKSVDATKCQTVVCIVFGLGDSVGSGIVVDLARHLSNVKFGRRALVQGIGIVPCEGDPEKLRDADLFPVLNELDCMLDEEKNAGVVQVWGDLYRNPFTSGFLLVPQQPVWEKTKDIDATKAKVYQELSSFLLGNQSLDFYESLRLLNWVGAPPTQHAAARSQYGKKWCHIFGFMDLDTDVEMLPKQLGLVGDNFNPDFFELRSHYPKSDDTDRKLTELASKMGKAFAPIVESGVISSKSNPDPSIQFILPGASKTDLAIFYQGRDLYDAMQWDEKLLIHSWLLELGVMLSEPAIRFDNMAGECLWGCACWVVVPYEAIRGEEAVSMKEKLEQVVKI